MRRPSSVRVVALVTVTAALALVVPAPASAAEPVRYDPPVDATVVDPYRAPAGPYAPGNRGIDFATVPGTSVAAAAGGEVTFAGQVGGTLHVVVLHDDGIRTSYSFLRALGVRRGDRVRAGQVVGVTAGALHFGARAGEVYLDPAVLLAAAPPSVHLVPVALRSPQSEGTEKGWLADALVGAGRLALAGVDATGAAVAWARDVARDGAVAVTHHVGAQLAAWQVRLAVLAHYVQALDPHAALVAMVAGLRAWHQGECTARGAPPRPRSSRRILVLVGGLGSAGGEAGVLEIDPSSLGYGPGDIAQFSYRGGRVPGVGALSGVPVSDYSAADSQGDLRDAGRRLHGLLAAIGRAHPGVPVDVVAHSQGGVVTRLALGPGTGHLPPLGAVVTLGSPHRGADLATAVALVGTTGLGGTVLGAAGVAVGLDPSSPAVRQLSEASGLMAELRHTPPPAGVRFTSIAARGDLVVPSSRSLLPGAENVIVPLDGFDAHGDLPGSALGRREVGLALAGLPPSCRPVWDVALDAVVASAIGYAEDVLGAAAGAGAIYVDGRTAVDAPVRVDGAGR